MADSLREFLDEECCAVGVASGQAVDLGLGRTVRELIIMNQRQRVDLDIFKERERA